MTTTPPVTTTHPMTTQLTSLASIATNPKCVSDLSKPVISGGKKTAELVSATGGAIANIPMSNRTESNNIPTTVSTTTTTATTTTTTMTAKNAHQQRLAKFVANELQSDKTSISTATYGGGGIGELKSNKRKQLASSFPLTNANLVSTTNIADSGTQITTRVATTAKAKRGRGASAMNSIRIDLDDNDNPSTTTTAASTGGGGGVNLSSSTGIAKPTVQLKKEVVILKRQDDLLDDAESMLSDGDLKSLVFQVKRMESDTGTSWCCLVLSSLVLYCIALYLC
jgi:hypothetical protein